MVALSQGKCEEGFLTKKNPAYEKPVLEPLLIVAEGIVPACINGSFVDGSCRSTGAAATISCDTGSSVLT